MKPSPKTPPRILRIALPESPTPCRYLATWVAPPSGPSATFSCSSCLRSESGVTAPARAANSRSTLVASACSSSPSPWEWPRPFQVPSAQKTMFFAMLRPFLGDARRSVWSAADAESMRHSLYAARSKRPPAGLRRKCYGANPGLTLHLPLPRALSPSPRPCRAAGSRRACRALDRTHAAVRGGLRAVRRQHLLRPAADRPHRGHAADARRPGRADHDADPARLRRRAALPGAAGGRGGKPPADPGRDGRRGRGPGRDRLVELGRRLSGGLLPGRHLRRRGPG